MKTSAWYNSENMPLIDNHGVPYRCVFQGAALSEDKSGRQASPAETVAEIVAQPPISRPSTGLYKLLMALVISPFLAMASKGYSD